jgi:hypothetical protein
LKTNAPISFAIDEMGKSYS